MNEAIARLNRLQSISFAFGALFLVGCCIGGVFNARAFFISWLFAFIFWIGLSLGCFYGAMIHYLVSGRWGFATRRLLEAGFATLPLLVLLFIPILFGLHELYPWARAGEVSADKLLRAKTPYESAVWFTLRAAFYFGSWLLIAGRLRSLSLLQDTTSDVAPTIKMRNWSGPGIAVVPLTVSFAMVDWAMSIEPKWYSTIFPVILLSGQMLTMFAFVIVVLAWLRLDAPLAEAERGKQYHDLGNLLQAFVLFWTYVSFSQILIIYSANEPHEIGWYLRRINGGWTWLLAFVALFHFFIPFFLLLFRAVNKNPRRLVIISLVLFVFQAANIFWTIEPTFYERIQIRWTDLTAWLGMGGLWLGVFCMNLKRHPLLARNDPRFEDAKALIANAK